MLGAIAEAELAKLDNPSEAEVARIRAEWKARVTSKCWPPAALHILGTERHESRHIDNQLRGRAGRKGTWGIAFYPVSGR